MNRTKKWVVLVTALFLLTNGVFYVALADHDEPKEKRWYQKLFDWDDDDDDHEKDRKDSEHYSKRYLNPVDNPTYKEESVALAISPISPRCCLLVRGEKS